MNGLRVAVGSFVLVAFSMMQGSAAIAAPTYNLFGDAALVSPGHNSDTAARLRSNVAGTGSIFGGVNFAIPAGTTLNDLTNLATDFQFTAASCGGGSPRFQINIDGENIFVYLGPPPNYTGCPANVWTSSGNLITMASVVDTSQLPGGTFYDPWAVARVKYGTHLVTGIQLVTDSSWFFGATQTVLVDNVMINATTYTFEEDVVVPGDKEKCKKGGWMDFTSDPGPFRNQGDCVSYFATGGRNKASP
jgi:hypothetical protein